MRRIRDSDYCDEDTYNVALLVQQRYFYSLPATISFSEISSLLETSYTRAGRFTDNANNREMRHLVTSILVVEEVRDADFCQASYKATFTFSSRKRYHVDASVLRVCASLRVRYSHRSVCPRVPRAEITPS